MSAQEIRDVGLEKTPSRIVPHVLVVDDEVLIGNQLKSLYKARGYSVEVATSGEEALERLARENIDLVVTDIRLPGMSGVELTQRVQQRWPDVPVIVITGFADISTAVNVLKMGAADFIVKPFDVAAIQESTELVLRKAQPFIEIRHLRRSLKGKYEFGGMLSRTPEMHRVFEIIRMVADTDMTVVIEGETGTGKELVASAIHYGSQRRDGPFITINCGGLPDSLLESELFGYEKGAFTGAERSKAGNIELAHGGTLFLDEIESMSLAMQSKLLLVLQDQRVQRLGATRLTRVDIRVIAATNVPLSELLEQGRIRNDFYYRINVIPIKLIPLRERLGDIPLLVQDFLRHHPVAVRKGITAISPNAMAQLQQYHWPGNVRELQNVLGRAIVLAHGKVVEEVDLPTAAPAHKAVDTTASEQGDAFSLNDWLQQQEKKFLMQKLQAFGGKINLTAKVCGIDVKTLYRKMRFYGLDKRSFRSGLDKASH